MITANPSDTDLYTETVAALTRAARQRQPDGTPIDFGDFLAHALAATAANVGGPAQLVAGRPGSWESAYVDGLVRGTIGDQPEDWTWYRTQPVVIPLNVAELIEDEIHHPGLMGLGEALENFDKEFVVTDEADVDAWEIGIETITARYAQEYRLYAERFTTAARALANLIPGLSADVYIEADTDPNSHWWSTSATTNPNRLDHDHLVSKVWNTAHDMTPLPDVDVCLGSGRGAGPPAGSCPASHTSLFPPSDGLKSPGTAAASSGELVRLTRRRASRQSTRCPGGWHG